MLNIPDIHRCAMTDVALPVSYKSEVNLVNPEGKQNESRVSVRLLQDLPEAVQERVKRQDGRLRKLSSLGLRLRKPKHWEISLAEDDHQGASERSQTEGPPLMVRLNANEVRKAWVRVSPPPKPDDYYALVVRQELLANGDLHAGHVIVVVGPGG
jgi:hypothetical protein